MATDKVTLRFESTIETPNSEPLLLSGPIQLFGTVDEFNELFNDTMKAAINEESSAEFNRIIVFVSDVANVEAQSHRGAYFLYVGSRPVEKKELDISDWREILLGTHSHSNMAALESLQDLASDKDEIVVAKPDGTFSIIDPKKLVEINGGVPALPAEIQAKIDYLKKYSYLEEPTESSLHHLDAPLEELTNTYDWLEKDSDGNYRNMAVGSCRDLYRRLLKLDNKLYLKDDYTIGTIGKINGWAYLEAQAYEINFDDENIARKNEDTEKWIISIDLPWNILKQDKVLLFNDKNELIEDFEISCNGRKAEIQLDLNDEQFEGIKKITLLAIKDAEKIDLEILKNKFRNNELSLGDINEALVRLFVEGELNRKPNIPNLYLTTDEYGTIKWDNKLLPAQYFYSNSIIVDDDYLKDEENLESDYIKLVFKDAKYDRKNGDFALLLADQYFVFDVFPDDNNLNDAVYLIPRNSRYLDKDETVFNLIVIKKTSAGAIADQVAENYISKKDAVDILSHGKINLKEYAKMTDLLNLSKIGHTHSQYALKGHNHDYRYANFYHTHPELLKAVAAIVGGNSDEIQAKLDELSEEEQLAYKKLIESLFTNAGFSIEKDENGDITSAKITDINIPLESTTIESINAILDASQNAKDLKLTDSSTVSDALKVIAEMFDRDTVLTSQVLLNSDITVKLANGPIGGIDTERTYSAGTSLESILKDMLNPYKSAEEIKTLLEPKTIKISWYRYDSFGDIKEVDPLHLPYGNNGGILLFTYKLLNKDGSDCKVKIIKNGKEFILKTNAILTNSKKIENGKEYYIYDNNFDFTQTKTEYEQIEFVFEKLTVYDNYGLNGTEVIFDTISVTPEFNIEFVDYFIGNIESLKTFSKEDIFELRQADENEIYKLVDIQEKPFIIIFIEDHLIDQLSIIDVLSGHNIKGFFKECNDGNGVECFIDKKYYGFYYEIYNEKLEQITLKIAR